MHFVSMSETGFPSSSKGCSLRFEIGIEVLLVEVRDSGQGCRWDNLECDVSVSDNRVHLASHGLFFWSLEYCMSSLIAICHAQEWSEFEIDQIVSVPISRRFL